MCWAPRTIARYAMTSRQSNRVSSGCSGSGRLTTFPSMALRDTAIIVEPDRCHYSTRCRSSNSALMRNSRCIASEFHSIPPAGGCRRPRHCFEPQGRFAEECGEGVIMPHRHFRCQSSTVHRDEAEDRCCGWSVFPVPAATTSTKGMRLGGCDPGLLFTALPSCCAPRGAHFNGRDTECRRGG
jgi:hypothetical protein